MERSAPTGEPVDAAPLSHGLALWVASPQPHTAGNPPAGSSSPGAAAARSYLH